MALKDKKKTEALIAVLEYLREHRILYDMQGIEIAGVYWDAIKTEVKEKCAGNLSRGTSIDPDKRNGSISVLFMGQVDSYLAECQNELELIKKEEYDRELDNRSKRAAIKANTIAKWAIGISVLAATGLPQYLLKWLYRTIVELFWQ